MAIIRFAFDRTGAALDYHGKPWAAGAYCPLDSYNPAEHRATHGAMVLWEEYQGLCLNDYERNGYDDSDFCMEIWDPVECRVFTITFATTRAWTYPSYGSKPDATPEVRAAVAQWRAEQAAKMLAAQRLDQAKVLREQRALVRKLAEKHGVPFLRLSKLVRSERSERVTVLLKLLKSALRSEFRIKLRTQLIEWLRSPTPAYPSPFSYRQWEYV